MQLCSACSHSSHTGPVITSCPCRPLQALTPVPHHPPGTRTTSHHRTFATKPAQPVTAASALLAACDLMLPAVPCTPSLASRGRSQPLPRPLPVCAHAFPTATHAYPHPRPTRRSLLLGLAFPRILIALTGSISTVAQASVSPSASTSASAPASASASSASASALAPAPPPLSVSVGTAASADCSVLLSLCLCLLLSMFHYSFLCKQVWDGAHPFWDAFTGLCVLSDKAQFNSSHSKKNSLYDASPEHSTQQSSHHLQCA